MDKYAILIGIEKYHDSINYKPVDYAENDVKSMSDILSKMEYNVKTFINENASDNVNYELQQLGNSLTENDQIIFYFSGHGDIDCDGKNILVLYDTSVIVENVINYLSKKCKKILIILDCCHSGLEANSTGRDGFNLHFYSEKFIEEMNHAEYCMILSACEKNESSYPIERFCHGAFTYRLLECLTGQIKDVLSSNKDLVFSLLSNYLRNTVPEDVKSENENHEQHPCTYGNKTSDFIIFNFDGKSLFTLDNKNSFLSDTERIKEIKFIYEEEGLIKSLPGFKKGTHQVYKTKTAKTESFVKEIGDELVQKDAERLFNNLHEYLSYSSKYNTPEGDSGERFFIFPDFNLDCFLIQDDDYPSYYILKRNLYNFENREIVFNEKFNEAFSETFNRLHIQIKDYRYNNSSFTDTISALSKELGYDCEINFAIEIYIPKIKCKLSLINNDLSIRYKEEYSPEQIINDLININSKFNGILF